MRSSWLIVLVALAAVAGASHRDAVRAASAAMPPALVAAIAKVSDVAECIDQSHATAAAFVARAFTSSQVRLNSGIQIVEAQGQDPCVCGNVNCEIIAFESTAGGRYRVVLNDYTIATRINRDGTAVSEAHDSAAVLMRTTYRFDGRAYVVTRHEEVYAATNTAKLDPMPVSFTTGASSTIVSSRTAGLGFPDRYAITAAGGQTLELAFTREDGRVGTLSVFSPNGARLRTADHGGLTVKLPSSGTYVIAVDGNDPEKFGTYTLRIAIPG